MDNSVYFLNHYHAIKFSDLIRNYAEFLKRIQLMYCLLYIIIKPVIPKNFDKANQRLEWLQDEC